MTTENSIEPEARILGLTAQSGRIARMRLFGLALAGTVFLTNAAFAESPHPDQQMSAPQTSAAVAKPSHEAGPRLSKFEARRIRQACRERANEHSVKGAERDAFLTKCYFGRVSHRGLRRECAQQAAGKGISDKNAVRDFVRECVKERSRQ